MAALVLANSPWASGYNDLSRSKIGLAWPYGRFELSLHRRISDGLMVVFFLVVGLKTKCELVVGRLGSAREAVRPVAAGGLVVLVQALPAGPPQAAHAADVSGRSAPDRPRGGRRRLSYPFPAGCATISGHDGQRPEGLPDP